MATSNPKPEYGEMLYSGAANRKMQGEYTGGHLYLYRDTLYYKSHGMNIQVNEVAIPLGSIREVGFFRTLGLVPNGLEIFLANGGIEHFVVNHRKDWKQHIAEAILSLNRRTL